MVAEPWPVRTGALAVAVAAHAIFFVLFVWRLGSSPELAAAPVMNVELAPPWTDKPRPSRPRPRPERIAGDAREPSASRTTPLAPAEERETDGVAEPGRDAVRQALRGGLGCRHADLLGLTAEERRRCEDRGTAQAQGAAPKLNLDGDGVFAAGKDPEPYLARKPRSGCKARAGGDVTPSGDHGAAAGIGCAWAF